MAVGVLYLTEIPVKTELELTFMTEGLSRLRFVSLLLHPCQRPSQLNILIFALTSYKVDKICPDQ